MVRQQGGRFTRHRLDPSRLFERTVYQSLTQVGNGLQGGLTYRAANLPGHQSPTCGALTTCYREVAGNEEVVDALVAHCVQSLR